MPTRKVWVQTDKNCKLKIVLVCRFGHSVQFLYNNIIPVLIKWQHTAFILSRFLRIYASIHWLSHWGCIALEQAKEKFSSWWNHHDNGKEAWISKSHSLSMGEKQFNHLCKEFRWTRHIVSRYNQSTKTLVLYLIIMIIIIHSKYFPVSDWLRPHA